MAGAAMNDGGTNLLKAPASLTPGGCREGRTVKCHLKNVAPLGGSRWSRWRPSASHSQVARCEPKARRIWMSGSAAITTSRNRRRNPSCRTTPSKGITIRGNRLTNAFSRSITIWSIITGSLCLRGDCGPVVAATGDPGAGQCVRQYRHAETVRKQCVSRQTSRRQPRTNPLPGELNYGCGRNIRRCDRSGI